MASNAALDPEDFLTDLFKDPRPVGLNLRCQEPLFTDLEPGQSGRTPTAVLSCYEIRHVLSPAGGVRENTKVPSSDAPPPRQWAGMVHHRRHESANHVIATVRLILQYRFI